MTVENFQIIADKLMKQYLDDEWKLAIWESEIKTVAMMSHGWKYIYVNEKHIAEFNKKDAREVLLHEIAHALTPGQYHNFFWKETFKQMGGTGNEKFYYQTRPWLKRKLINKRLFGIGWRERLN